MKRAATLSVLACLLVVTGAAPSAPEGSAGAEVVAGKGPFAGSLLDSVPERGVLRVCTTGDYRPFTHLEKDTGAYRGIDVDMARDLAESLDAKASFVATTWKNLTGDLAGGRCDLAVGGVSVTLERAREVAFSEPTREDGKTPIVRCEDEDRYRTLRQIDRPGTTVVVNPGGTNEEFARAHIRRATIKEHPENTTIFEEIVAGRADVMMTDASETLYQAKLHPELCSVHPEKPFTFAEKAYAVPRGDAEFREYVDRFVHLATHDGTYERYEDEWMK
ncbi:transporter substrate-binding domain-containing protein [Streptomyces sp. HNM0574]|uniref:transporter substrate-binding domain-containing protein n=1 Tax=Streptomyces sp. HNM0574 TaxID=2714954 RepID=UPI00146DFDD4|nr:transporter substrate-binding domain-containing protein [Streptomyces sp. HNM0574]NLU67528.1 transporter substrate-binding domain-containing protein [Streptomyces sp. HNM0574]